MLTYKVFFIIYDSLKWFTSSTYHWFSTKMWTIFKSTINIVALLVTLMSSHVSNLIFTRQWVVRPIRPIYIDYCCRCNMNAILFHSSPQLWLIVVFLLSPMSHLLKAFANTSSIIQPLHHRPIVGGFVIVQYCIMFPKVLFLRDADIVSW